MPAFLFSGLPAYAWQVVFHSFVAGTILYVWAHFVELSSGRAKRFALAALLVLPLVTAAVPGRTSLEFRAAGAWLDSSRLLAVPLGGPARVWHVVVVLAAGTAVVTIVQEIVPALRRRRLGLRPAPESVERLCRALPGWEKCRVRVRPGRRVHLATSGRPSRPRVLLSEGAIESLGPDELLVALRHENAHWSSGRWLLSHVLFALRLLQLHNPVALWSFREYCVEVEIQCDAEAVAGSDPRLLARTLLDLYDSTHRRDIAARAAFRKRVDLLLERDGPALEAPTPRTVIVASCLLLGALPWLV